MEGAAIGTVVAVRRAVAIHTARAVGRLSRRLGRGGGTSAPGAVLLRLYPDAVSQLGARLDHGAICVSATNGKTTTCRLVAACLDAGGDTLVSNPAGANLLTGVATALLDAPRNGSGPRRGLFEVDEAALPEVARRLQPRVVVLMNLFRDQLDRYGELETLASAWTQMVAALPRNTLLVLNADDPAIAALDDGQHRCITFGIDDDTVGTTELGHASDSTRCRFCEAPLRYTRVTLGHMGHWHCDACGRGRPTPDVAATRVRLDATRGLHVTWRTPEGEVDTTVALPGLHNAYNATAALATAVAAGVSARTAAAAIGTAQAAFGRAERLSLDGREVVLLLAKNPAGANTTVQTLLLDAEPLHVLVALNDRTADGHDVSWIWDVDYEPLIPHIARLVVTGDRAYDMALRWAYGGLDRDRIEVVPSPAAALDAAVAATPEGSPLYVLPTYTAMLGLRAVLTERGAVQEFWRER